MDKLFENAQNLVVGQEIKGYRQLCELLDEQPTTGCSKTAQLKEWRRYFDWEKRGHKFIITDIYQEPIPKAMREGTVYAKLIETLLVAYLSKQENFTYTATEPQIFETLCMVSPNYRKIRDKETFQYLTAPSGENSVSPINYIDFNNRSHKRLKEILYSALNSMVSRRLLEYNKETVIVITHEDIDSPRKVHENIVANPQEVKEIVAVERQVLNTMGADNIFQVYAANKTQEYYKNVDSILKEKFGWDHVYRRLRLIYNQPSLTEALEQTKRNLFKAADQQDVQINKQKLNAAIFNMFNTEAQKRVSRFKAEKEDTLSKMLDSGEWFGNNSLPDKIKYKEYIGRAEYVTEQKFLAEYFVKN